MTLSKEQLHANALLDERDAAEYLGGFTPRFLQARRLTGDGPAFIRISSRAIRYRVRDLDEWVEARKRTSTSDNPEAA